MLDQTDITEPRYQIRKGAIDGKSYAVFRDEFARGEYARANPAEFIGCAVVCFGAFDNAFLLKD